MDEFKPSYPGDNPNRAWVRRKAEEKGIRTDFTEVIKRMSGIHVKCLFEQMMRDNAPWDLISRHIAAEEENR